MPRVLDCYATKTGSIVLHCTDCPHYFSPAVACLVEEFSKFSNTSITFYMGCEGQRRKVK